MLDMYYGLSLVNMTHFNPVKGLLQIDNAAHVLT